MREFMLALTFLLVTGLADKSIAYILMRGSIFKWLREGIEQRKDQGSWLFSKLHDLFSCNLCMTAQVAIWFFAMPIMAFSWRFHPMRSLMSNTISWGTEIILTFFIGFLIAMAIAAVAKVIWELFEYLPAKAEAEALHRAKIIRLLAKIGEKGNIDPNELVFLLADNSPVSQLREKFWELWQDVAQYCDPMGCPFRRADCVKTKIKAAESWLPLMPGVSSDDLYKVLVDMARLYVSEDAYARPEATFQDFCERLGFEYELAQR